MSGSRKMCTSLGHEDETAVGEAQVEDDPRWYPYCSDCLVHCDPPLRWYRARRDDVGTDRLVRAVVEALVTHDWELRSLHHTYPRLDANARQLIAELAVAAIVAARPT